MSEASMKSKVALGGQLWLLRLLALLLLAACLTYQQQVAEATLNERLLWRRQSDTEQEGTTQASAAAAAAQTTTPATSNQQANGALPPRLYPDLPGAYAPNHHPYAHHYPPNHGPTPFVPFGLQLPANRISGIDPSQLPRLPPQPRPMTASDRLQSQTFVSGLGKRLLAMAGVEPQQNETSSEGNNSDENSQASPQQQQQFNPEATMRALQNSTILHQLNKRLQSIYGGLSKMYNSTVQQQLDLLQERFRRESENSTNPWQQRMAQQVPQFFKSMVARVDEAQMGLNNLWQQLTQANNGSISQQPAANFFNQFMPNDDMHPSNFFNNLGRSLGFGNDGQTANRRQMNGADGPSPGAFAGPGMDLGSQLRDFWHNQVQPQIGMLRNQMGRVWRDLTATGALTPMMVNDVPIRRNDAAGDKLDAANSNKNNADSGSSDLVDDILKSVDINSPEYTLVDSKVDQPSGSSNQQAGASNANMWQQQQVNMLANQMQTGLMNAQRELNQLWNGLSRSLQSAIGNARNTLNPRPPFGPNDSGAANNQDVDPAANEIDTKIKDLSKLQKDANTVYEVVQQQQQAQMQPRPSIGDRFRNFLNNANLDNFDQIPNRFGDSMARFGTAVGDLWHQIPERWDNFVTNMRRPQDQQAMIQQNGRLTAAAGPATSPKPTTTTSSSATTETSSDETSPAAAA